MSIVISYSTAVTNILFPSLLKAVILALCALTIAIATDNPIPCPPVSELRELSVL